ncbi:MAG: hypothetical protein Q8Q12_07905, partial [bacterium]|nr:hypothetical protein [bacterium]
RAYTPVRCKFILASADELHFLEREKGFSSDLANRIKPGRIPLRPVRDYNDADLTVVLEHLWKLVWRKERISLTPPTLPDGFLRVVREFPFSGNLRQLDSAFAHVLRQFVGNAPSTIDSEVYVSKFRDYLPTWERSDRALDSVLPTDDSRVLTLDEVDKRYARWAHGKCGNKKRTAEALGISHVTLNKLLREDEE